MVHVGDGRLDDEELDAVLEYVNGDDEDAVTKGADPAGGGLVSVVPAQDAQGLPGQTLNQEEEKRADETEKGEDLEPMTAWDEPQKGGERAAHDGEGGSAKRADERLSRTSTQRDPKQFQAMVREAKSREELLAQKHAIIEGFSLKTNDPDRTKRIAEMTAKGEHFRLMMYVILMDQRFDLFMGLVITANSVTIGLESHGELSGWDMTGFLVLEHLFLVIYVFELCLRFYALRWACLKSGWVRFDLLMVVQGVIMAWIVNPIIKVIISGGGEDTVTDSLEVLMVLRVFRLARLARAVRLLVQFRTLWMLVRGLLSAAGAIVYTCILIFILLYIFACVTVELITKPWLDSDDAWKVQQATEHWPDILTTMLTLSQFVTFDSAAAIYAPLMKRSFICFAVFVPFFLIVSIALMNLVTATIVQNALDQAAEDREVQTEYRKQKIKAMIPEIIDMFSELDADGSGMLTLEELQMSDQAMQAELIQYMKVDSLAELFELIDVDGSGEVNIREFCDGIVRLAASDDSPEFVRIIKQLEVNKMNQAKILEDRKAFEARVNKRLDIVNEKLDKLLEGK